MNDSFFSLHSFQVTKTLLFPTYTTIPPSLTLVEISSASSWPLCSSLGGRITTEFSSVFVPAVWESGRCFNKTQTAETSVILTTLCWPSVGTTAEDQYLAHSISPLPPFKQPETFILSSSVFMWLHRITRWFLTIAKFSVLVFFRFTLLKVHCYKSWAFWVLTV